ncbi:MAG: EFR1 family ferrodoxin [Spirochaeta sp.]|jgi:ferredoxin|nr:EFR1 family ferrodoxin [Spirochaeta sp.]
MDTTVYYFSATGNSLAVAREIAQRLDAGEAVSIPQALVDGDGSYDPANLPAVTGEVIGIVCPIYMHNLPHIVARFVQQITAADYLFFVFAGGGELGNGARTVRRLFSRRGLTLDALFNVPMPSNYTPYGAPDKASRQDQFSAAADAITTIVDTVQSRSPHTDSTGTGFVATHIFPGPLYRLGHRFIPKMDGNFTVDDTCTKCGICRQVCPVGNITLHDGRPVWHHTCEQCFACLQWCPVHAIQYGKKTRGVERYHHPEVNVRDIISSAPDGPETSAEQDSPV